MLLVGLVTEGREEGCEEGTAGITGDGRGSWKGEGEAGTEAEGGELLK
jgi:hypothetical protein